jgi:hypothetical protein
MKCGWIATAVFYAGILFAREGIVSTLDGRRLEGEITATNGALLVKTTRGELFRIIQTDIARAQFSTNIPPAVAARGSGNGLLGFYFNSTNFQNFYLTRLDSVVDFNWHSEAPFLGLAKQRYGVRWMGQIEAPTSGVYTIYFASQDGGKIYLDGQLVADAFSNYQFLETNTTMTLRAGERRNIQLEYHNTSGVNARAQLFWSTESIPKTIIPQDRLYAASFDTFRTAETSGLAGSRGLLATYYNSERLSSNSFTRIEPEVNLAARGEPPAPGIVADPFTVRWSGTLLITNNGEYKFFITGGTGVRFLINDKMLSEPSSTAPEQVVTTMLNTADHCELRLELRARTDVPVRLHWSGPRFEKMLLSRQHVSPVIAASRQPPGSDVPISPAGVLLVNGATLSAPIQSATGNSIRFQGVLGKQNLPLAKVACIHVKPLTPELARAIPSGRAGVLLKNRDFFDGEVAAIESGRLKMTSVLFGNRSYDLAKDVIAIIVRSKESEAWLYSVTARDGTVLYGKTALIQPAQVSLAEGPEFSVPIDEVEEIVRRSEKEWDSMF